MTGGNPFEEKLRPRFEYADLYTFVENKVKPVYNWFYYKEGFGRDFVWNTLEELKIPGGATVLDPFCGTGTTLLASKEMGMKSIGFDILPLGVFVSRVKLRDYDLPLLEEAVRHVTGLRYSEPRTKLVDIRFLDMRRVYTPFASNDIAFFRERILEVQDEAHRDFLLLGLLSIVSQASNVMKDGGVLKLVRKRHLPPVRVLLSNKLKRMLRDLKTLDRGLRTDWRVDVGDARDVPLEDGSVDCVVTSPPYLNFVDYTRVYALELSLLVSSARDLETLRRRSMRSHVGAEYDGGGSDVGDILGRVTKTGGDVKVPQVVEGYLRDLYLALSENHRVLKDGGYAVYVVGNASLPGVTVDVDLMVAEMGERLGFKVEDIWVGGVRWAGVHGIEKERPARESAVVLRK